MEYMTTRLNPIKTYPTYQFRADAVTSAVGTERTFVICVLETLKWLRSRLKSFDSLPADIIAPEPEDHMSYDISQLHSFSFSMGLTVDVTYIPKEGVWSFHLSEPDMGANIGTPNERRAVQGRIFDTDISFRKRKDGVSAGFRTLCSEPADSDAPCEVFRPTVVKAIMENPDTGFEINGMRIDGTPLVVSGKSSVERMAAFSGSEKDSLPVVLIAETGFEENVPKLDNIRIPDVTGFNVRSGFSSGAGNSFSIDFSNSGIESIDLGGNDKKPKKKTAPAPDAAPAAPERKKLPDLDYKRLASSVKGFALVCFAEEPAFRLIKNKLGCDVSGGDVLIFNSTGEPERYSVKNSLSDMDGFYKQIKSIIKQLTKRRSYSYGDIVFNTDARLLDLSGKQSENLSLGEQLELSRLENAELKKQVREYSQQNTDMQNISGELRAVQKKLRSAEDRAEALDILVRNKTEELETKDKLLKKTAALASFYAKQAAAAASFPTHPDEICGWIDETFPDTIAVSPSARASMRKYDGTLEPGILCDGIVYLDAYARYLMGKITADELSLYAQLNSWEAGSCGKEALRVRRDDYLYSYNGKKYLMDMHIKHGVNPRMLIRVYFCWDGELGKIIIGHMPDHLATVRQNT